MKRILIAACILLAVGAVTGWKYYKWIYHANTQEGMTNLILLPEGSGYTDVFQALSEQEILVHPKSFEWVAKRMHFNDQSVKAGRYFVQPGTSNYALIQKLRLGEQDAIDLVINSAHTLEDLAGIIGKQLEVDSFTFLQYMRSDYLPESNYTQETILSLFIPNTYEVWWNVRPDKLLARMESEHARFWNAERKAAAENLSMTSVEVYTLASIVESETQARDERAAIAGVYHNRLNQNIPLQADPTVRFALKDLSLRRIMHKHLEIESPYNTYLHPGLPPGPIAMPTIHSIDAVLKPEKHDYIFFCAKPGNDGRHLFAKTLSGHLENARQYQAWLNEQGIR
ncbi:MAG TPA: endolytic transglycosylase MltG [Saprospiraceae bacterium]|nr:endolytic transglycosylase MltG [Saprospiraceae bacterium]